MSPLHIVSIAAQPCPRRASRLPLSCGVRTAATCLAAVFLAAAGEGGPPLPSGELLVDACFPDTTLLQPYNRTADNPWLPGEWNAESALVGPAAGGISPLEGTAMLRVNLTGGTHSQVSHIVDVSAWAADIDAGNVFVSISASTNASVATAAPSVSVIAGTSQTVVGTLNPVGGPLQLWFNRGVAGMTTDADPSTWQSLRTPLRLPSGTRFLHFEVAGANSTIPVDGVYFDCASLYLFPRVLGDLNCDGVVTVSDIAAFVLALTDPVAYAAQYPGCDVDNADVNNDGQVTVSDVGPFVGLLTGV